MQAGTPAFQPPEQLKGELCGEGSDVYALGCIMTELFGEKPIWSNLSPHTIILKVAGGDFPGGTRETVREALPGDTTISVHWNTFLVHYVTTNVALQ